MAVEVNALYAPTDLSNLAEDWNDRAQPVIDASGAVESTCWMALSGPMTGMFAVSTRWETLGQWATASADMAARMVEGGDLADLAARYQITQRIVTVDLVEAGSPSGPFLNASRYSATAPPVGLDHAAERSVAAGANGVRISSVLSGGEMTGHLIGAIYLDSFDVLPDLLASLGSDAQFGANTRAMGGRLEGRTLFRRV